MKIYEKYLISESNNEKELNETNIIGAINTFKKAIKLIGDLIILTKVDLDEYEVKERSSDILNELDKILKSKNIDPIYRDMIRYGVKTALKNLNRKNRLNIGY